MPFYNNNDSLTTLDGYLKRHSLQLLGSEDNHVIWAGNFNRHHPLWDDETQLRLFTPRALNDANRLINFMAEWEMELILSKKEGPTLHHKVMKSLSWPDLVLCRTHSKTPFASCQVKEEEKPVHTDHFPIAYSFALPANASIIQDQVSFNFRATDWEKFGEELQIQLLNQDLTNPI